MNICQPLLKLVLYNDLVPNYYMFINNFTVVINSHMQKVDHFLFKLFGHYFNSNDFIIFSHKIKIKIYIVKKKKKWLTIVNSLIFSIFFYTFL